MRYNLILNILGLNAKYIGYLFIFPIIAAILLKESSEILPFLITGLVAILLGYFLSFNKVSQKEVDSIKKSESLTTVFFSLLIFYISY